MDTKKSIEELKKYLYEIIEKETDNRMLINNVKKYFAEKQLSLMMANHIFRGNIDILNIEDIEDGQMALITLTNALYKEGYDYLDPKKYFENVTLVDWDNFKKDNTVLTPENARTTIEIDIDNNIVKFNNVVKNPNKNDEFTINYLTAYDLYLLSTNQLIRYNKETQREGVRKSINGKAIKTISVNKQSVRDISNYMLKNEFPNTTISFNVLRGEGKKPSVKYIDGKNQLIIRLNDDFESKETCLIDAIDGWHRKEANDMAVIESKRDGLILDTTFTVQFTVWNVDKAQNLIATMQKHNDMSKEYVDVITKTPVNDVAKMFEKIGNKNNNYLFNNVGLTYDDYKFDNKATHLSVIAGAIKNTDLDLEDEWTIDDNVKDIVKIINMMIEYMKKAKNYNSFEEMKKNSKLLDCNIFVGYIAIANEIRKCNDYKTQIMEVCNKIIELDSVKSDLDELKLNHKMCTISTIYNYFKELV